MGDETTRQVFTRQSPFSDPGRFAAEFESLPQDIAGLQKMSSGLVFHYRDGGDWTENGIAADRVGRHLSERSTPEGVTYDHEVSARPHGTPAPVGRLVARVSAFLPRPGLPWPAASLRRPDLGLRTHPFAGVLRTHPFAGDALVAGALAVVLLPTTISSMLALRLPTGWAAAVLTSFCVLHLTPAARRTVPFAGYAVACASMLVVVIAPNGRLLPADSVLVGFPMLFLPSSLVFLPVLHGVAVNASRRAGLLGLLGAVCGVGLAGFRIGETVPGHYPRAQYLIYVTVALLVAVVAAWGLGTARAVRTRLAAAERAEATRSAILTERARIARDMHDIVAHSLALIVRQAEGGALIAPRSPDRAVEVLNTISACGRDALDDLRGMLGVLRSPGTATTISTATGTSPGGDAGSGPGTGTDPGVPSAPQPSLADLDALCERVSASGTLITRTESGTAVGLGAAAELAAYHVVLESLTNTVKHAGHQARVDIQLEWHDDRLILLVQDDGGHRDRAEGGQTRHQVPGSGVGLPGLRERVHAVGGDLVAGPRERGFVVRADLPRRTAKRRP